MVQSQTERDDTEERHEHTFKHDTASFPRPVLMLVAIFLKLYVADISDRVGKDHYGSVILVDSLGQTDFSLYVSEARRYEGGRVGKKHFCITTDAIVFLFLKVQRPLNQNSQHGDATFWRGMSNETGGSIGHRHGALEVGGKQFSWHPQLLHTRGERITP